MLGLIDAAEPVPQFDVSVSKICSHFQCGVALCSAGILGGPRKLMPGVPIRRKMQAKYKRDHQGRINQE